jgi:hypothetical protein
VLLGIGQHLGCFLDQGRPLGVTQHHRVLEPLVVPLGVDDAELVALLSQSLQEAGGESGFAAARSAGHQQVHALRREAHLLVRFLVTQQDPVAGEPRLELGEVVV